MDALPNNNDMFIPYIVYRSFLVWKSRFVDLPFLVENVLYFP